MSKVVSFGEVLWDKLPSGKVPGGAPLNFGYRLNSFEKSLSIISKVGDDSLGKELIEFLNKSRLETRHIQISKIYKTGEVNVSIDKNGIADPWKYSRMKKKINYKLIKSKTFLWSSLTHFFIGSSLIIVMVIIPLSGSTVFGLDSLTIGLSLLKLTAFIGLGSIVGIFFTRLSLTLTLILGSILITSGTLIYSNNIKTPTNEIDYIFYILGIGFGLFIVPIHNTGLHKISENIRGISSSMISLSRMLGMIFGLSLMTTIGTARFSDLVSGMNILSLDPDIQQKINKDINSAGIEVFNEIMFGAFIFSIITFFTSLILIYYYRRNQ